jgi:hypothetical protein
MLSARIKCRSTRVHRTEVCYSLFPLINIHELTGLRRRFFETEGVAILTMLIAKYKITVKEEPQFAGETFEQRKERILKSHAVITLT